MFDIRLSTFDLRLTVARRFILESDTDSLPFEVRYEFAVPNASETNGSDYAFNLGMLTGGASATITISVTVTSPVIGVVTNWVSVTTTNAEFILGNNRALWNG